MAFKVLKLQVVELRSELESDNRTRPGIKVQHNKFSGRFCHSQ